MAGKNRKATQTPKRGNSGNAVPPFGSCTDVGCYRDHNEDSLSVVPPLFMVADGMGGHAAGEIASEIAVNVVTERAPRTADSQGLADAIVAANRAILRAAALGQGRSGMGTTCTAAILDGTRLAIAHVGDSRAYLLHKGELQQITQDHSLVANMVASGEITPEEARIHPKRSVITRALGSFADMEADRFDLDVEVGDKLLLCTDGLYSMVEDHVIKDILLRTKNPQHAAAMLTEEALDMGGHDNVTCIVVDVTDASLTTKRTPKKARLTAAAIAVVLIALVGGSVWGLNSWAHNSVYLMDQDGKVAIYKGIPEKVLWCDYRELAQLTDVSTDKLNPGLATRLKEEGIRCDDLKTARKLTEGYAADIAAQEAAQEAARKAAEAAEKNRLAAEKAAAEKSSTEKKTPSKKSSSKASSAKKSSSKKTTKGTNS